MKAGNHDIRFLKREELDTAKWDLCIGEAGNEMIYAYAGYLDHMAIRWDALVMNDYEAVMPLTWNRKWGIPYLYQPPLTPQLGIFSIKPVEQKLIGEFLNHIPGDFRFAEIFFNHGNEYPIFRKHDNYILDLNPGYERISGEYRQDLKNNLKKSGRFSLVYAPYPDLEKALGLHQAQYQARTPHVRKTDYQHFESLCKSLLKKDALVLRSVSDQQSLLLSVALLMRTKKRLYLIESTTPEQGRAMGANHFLLDAIIREFSGRDLILDFVGSDLPGIAHFYRNFGSINQPYFFYYLNHLPWPLRLFK